MLNNGMDDLGKFDPRRDEGVFVGYSSSSKAYRILNKRTQCIGESIHVVFDEDGILRNNGSNDEDDVIKLFNSQEIEGSEAEAGQQLKNDYDDQNHSLSEETDEVGKCDEVPSTTQNSIQSTSNSPKMMSLLMKKNMLISLTNLLQDQDGSIVHHILLIILSLP